ncbi:hypothetical protein PVAND_015660 [Polypedilum vanderplanki]|uniref:Glucuronosyltransferase n=1 Tax=Polypedilum vanderplanki TaxID=319348 RepID=A0A9J6BDM7_POLVA|nr:hypothetical protein PVAND_015660 [Polypedilum vanderplanki]
MRSILIVTLVLFFLTQCYSIKNILYLHHMLSPSHHLWNSKLAKSLANIGYNVTFLSIDFPKRNVKNLHYIVIENVYDEYMKKTAEILGDTNWDIVKYAEEASDSKLFAALGLNFYCSTTCNAIMSSNSSWN